MHAPLEVEGDAMGMDLATFAAKYRRATALPNQPAPHLDFGNVFSADRPVLGVVERNYRRSGLVKVTKSTPAEMLGQGFVDTFVGVPARITYNFNAATLADWDAAARPYRESGFAPAVPPKPPTWTAEEETLARRLSLGTAFAIIRPEDFPAVVRALTARYGPPTLEQKAIVRDRQGVAFDNQWVIWRAGNDAIVAVQRNLGITEGQIEFLKMDLSNRMKQRITAPLAP